MKPGMIVFPLASKVRAPAGTLQRPKQTMRLPRTTSVPLTTSRLRNVTRRALVKATVPAGMARGTVRAMRVVSERFVVTE